MSTFTAKNIEYDNASDSEVDDTKELQIEEALKLYQAAIKYHSEGPESYGKAAEAYTELFQSEIFKYTESLSELRRSELYDSLPEYQELYETSFDPVAQPLVATGESAPNTLPQILHLSYKNHGQFLLDVLQHRVHGIQQTGQALFNAEQIKTSAKLPINHFAEALDKDDTDLDLWRCSASVANLVGSSRIARYCLESVLDGDSEGLDSLLGPPGIEDGLALHQLRSLVEDLKDDLTLLTAPLNTFRKKNLSVILRRLLDPYPRMTKPSFESTAYSLIGHEGKPPTRYVITAARSDWTSIGETMIQQFVLEQGGIVDVGPGAGIGFKLPEPTPENADDQTQAIPEAEGPPETENVPEKDGQVATKSESLAQDDKDAEGQETSDQNDQNGDQTAGEDANKSADDVNLNQDRTEPQPPAAPSRKRSTESAGMGEVAEGGRSRSKRIRARGTLEDPAATTAVVEAKKDSDEDLQPFLHADEELFDTVQPLLDNLQITDLIAPGILRDFVKDGPVVPSSKLSLRTAIVDFYGLARSWTPDTATILLHGDGESSSSRETGLNAFLGHENTPGSRSSEKPLLTSDCGLGDWVESVNSSWTSTKDAALMWLTALTRSGSYPGAKLGDQSTYLTHRWPEDLKRAVAQIAVHADSYVFERAQKELHAIEEKILLKTNNEQAVIFEPEEEATFDMIETMFELHLDIHALMKSPSMRVGPVTRSSQLNQLDRWSSMANFALYMRNSRSNEALDELSLRHIWATAIQLSTSPDVTQEHIIACIRDLKEMMHSLGDPVIQLPNNTVIPELSVAAADQRLSQMNMKDFFLKVFSDEEKDPVAIIESLEPLLEISHISNGDSSLDRQASLEGSAAHDGQSAETLNPADPMQEMSKFLSSRGVSLRLSLWKRLQEAYESIDYQPKVVSCHLRSIELLMEELHTASFVESEKQQRIPLLLRWLRAADVSVTKILSVRNTTPSFLECIDSDHLRSSMSAIARLCSLIQAPVLYDDTVRVELNSVPSIDGRRFSYAAMVNKINDMLIRAWTLQYLLLKEAMEQFPEKFPSPAKNRLAYLKVIHQATGIRGACSAAGHMFLRYLKDELLALSDLSDANIELCQVLWDLYGLQCFQNPADSMDHDADPEPLTRPVALKLLGFLLIQAQKMALKDLPKADLKTSIDKVHAALGRTKLGLSDDIMINRRLCNAFLKAAVNPLNLYSCIRGTFELPTRVIPPSEAPIAEKGWYFLMGNAALHKYRSQKRLQAGPTEELDQAVTFLLQDLEYSTEQWETWYRLAQTYDAQLEESVSWSAEKLNSQSNDVTQFQRSAINAYTMAVSCAIRASFGIDSEELQKKIGELYSDFGNRIYASSREPFSMRAYGVNEQEERHYNNNSSQMYRGPPFKLLGSYNSWKFAAGLFRQAIKRSPDQWPNYYMLGKCLWKMWTAQVKDLPEESTCPNFDDVLDSFSQAINKLPSRDSRKEPILEPHYKLVSVVHKLVIAEALEPKVGSEVLKATFYAANVSPPIDLDGWEPYVLGILKNLRAADKSGWHHRMTARAAQIVYDGSGKDMFGAMGAKHELTQQMFTKTMAVQVWKPEFERPGRHFVYTTRYVRLFIELLDKTSDTQNFEALARRIRRKPHDFFEHTKLWQESCLKYLKLLRRSGKIPEGHEDAVFKSLNHEEFSQRASALEKWCHANTSSTLDTLREVIELKKLNNGLMKSTLIDDLIGDTYARLYEEVTPTLSVSPPVAPPTAENPTKAPALTGTGIINMRGGPGSDQTPVFHGYQPQPPTEHVAKPRSKGVGKRAVAKSAEAAVLRPLTQTTTVPLRGPSTPRLQQPSSATIVTGANSAAQAGGVGEAAAGEGASVPGSVHDSADDESGSELSDLDDTVEDGDEDVKPTVIKSMFPGLAATTTLSTGSSSTIKADEPDQVDEDSAEQQGGSPSGLEEQIKESEAEDDEAAREPNEDAMDVD